MRFSFKTKAVLPHVRCAPILLLLVNIIDKWWSPLLPSPNVKLVKKKRRRIITRIRRRSVPVDFLSLNSNKNSKTKLIIVSNRFTWFGWRISQFIKQHNRCTESMRYEQLNKWVQSPKKKLSQVWCCWWWRKKERKNTLIPSSVYMGVISWTYPFGCSCHGWHRAYSYCSYCSTQIYKNWSIFLHMLPLFTFSFRSSAILCLPFGADGSHWKFIWLHKTLNRERMRSFRQHCAG